MKCACGCGNEIIYKPYHKHYKPDYINGHQRNHLGHKHSEETKQKLRLLKLDNNNPKWKGDKIKNRQLHQWVRSRLPEPEFCEICKIKSPFDLANITGLYTRDLSNWQYLCRSCHIHSDGRINNLRNQETTI